MEGGKEGSGGFGRILCRVDIGGGWWGFIVDECVDDGGWVTVLEENVCEEVEFSFKERWGAII